METKTDSPVAAPADVSLMRGGPFYRVQEATRLIRPNEWNLVRRITFAIALGWLPLLLITAVFNRGALISLIKDYRVTSRMLIAVPVLILGQLLLESFFRSILAYVRDADLLEGPDLARMDGAITTLVRLRDSLLPELVILLLVIVRTATAFKAQVDATPWLAWGNGADLHLTLAGWYAVLVSASIFQFLLGLNLWKWLLWTLFAFKLSGLNLKLVPSHPDEHGGLGFLGLSPTAFAPTAFAATVVIGATFRHQILRGDAQLMTFKLPAIALLVIVALFALGPVVFFVPRLAALRRKGLLEYGILGQMQSIDFHEKWIRHRVGHETELLDAPEISTLCDYGHAFDKIKRLKPFPTDRVALIGLAISVVVPTLPTILAQIPLAVVLKDLLHALH